MFAVGAETKIAYVVLQYGGFDTTEMCLNSLESLDGSSSIVLVDNSSPDDACSRAKEYALCHEHIHIVESDVNSGFSHGNNLGYQYARDVLHADYIVVLNNDVEIRQRDFEKRVEEIYQETSFAVLGPDIYVPARKEHQNPFNVNGAEDIWHPNNPSVTDLNALLDYIQLQIDKVQEPSAKEIAIARLKESKVLSSLRTLKHEVDCGRKAKNWQKNWSGRCMDVPLQGACYVFSQDFISAMPLCFTPEPFLYCEEIILQMNCRHLELRMVYDPSIVVVHHEGVSTNKMFSEGQDRQRALFQLTNKYKATCLCGLHRIKLDSLEGRASEASSVCRIEQRAVECGIRYE
jgi:GT2 family glycosyltransferase